MLRELVEKRYKDYRTRLREIDLQISDRASSELRIAPEQKQVGKLDCIQRAAFHSKLKANRDGAAQLSADQVTSSQESPMFKLKKQIALSLVSLFVILHITMPASAARTPTARRLVPEAFTVEAGYMRYWSFQVSGSARVFGRFRAEGGGGNDIEVYIFDEDQFENYKNGHRTPTYYNSGRITVARINVNLPENNYVLVFNNKYSVLTNKAITANIEIE